MFRFRWIGPALQWMIVAGIVLGAVSAFRSGREHSELQAEHRRLAARVGELDAEDPEKVWLVALETGDPMHFAWRVYLPADYRLSVRRPNGGSLRRYTEAAEFIARVRFRDKGNDEIGITSSFGPDLDRSWYAHGDGARFVRAHREAFDIEQLGTDGPVSIDPDKAADLLRIRLPAALQKQAETELDVRSAARLDYFLSLDPNDERF